MHGYIWNGNQWVPEAKRPQDREKVNKKSESNSNFEKKFPYCARGRPPET